MMSCRRRKIPAESARTAPLNKLPEDARLAVPSPASSSRTRHQRHRRGSQGLRNNCTGNRSYGRIVAAGQMRMFALIGGAARAQTVGASAVRQSHRPDCVASFRGSHFHAPKTRSDKISIVCAPSVANYTRIRPRVKLRPSQTSQRSLGFAERRHMSFAPLCLSRYDDSGRRFDRRLQRH